MICDCIAQSMAQTDRGWSFLFPIGNGSYHDQASTNTRHTFPCNLSGRAGKLQIFGVLFCFVAGIALGLTISFLSIFHGTLAIIGGMCFLWTGICAIISSHQRRSCIATKTIFEAMPIRSIYCDLKNVDGHCSLLQPRYGKYELIISLWAVKPFASGCIVIMCKLFKATPKKRSDKRTMLGGGTMGKFIPPRRQLNIWPPRAPGRSPTDIYNHHILSQ
ncbi:uncharacterized protein LOC131884753 isoform X1 [Tigriopus californicus]|uniref:uncharacterized protein LOC131884753 isoform X1 n=1 Tax=Tigriopus californicus TaxID=6832 RepID=UPI0027D9EBA9|nr:uncharacterized protein LOC131884753 isoform X1 [Tigriopus californicus]